MAQHAFTDDEEGKTVVDSAGNEIGVIAEVRNNGAYVEPDAGMLDKVQAKLGMGDAGEDTFRIESDEIETITDDEVRIRGL
ncbi:PRC-barrel domain containing protein (plasmid) [Haloferacaceae archaeon DSL9]